MLRKVKDFFEEEYISTVKLVNSTNAKDKKRIVVDRAISRCLGVTQFAQSIGLTYEEIESVYNHYKKLFGLLLDR